ncbi:hypothetical protein EJ04DRAFT_509922 [Polyplosphaeria fusca]|uniref:Peptidase S54 rhomboid domain-containing protein n=1 Tax=Polyplosphaeria fusca TaxID=682080 RepID=A0A9P4V2Z9_9PLEO|nr:hypothetical protein EJ04DRAFT_509922 [Polyplosphaeria fusca]
MPVNFFASPVSLGLRSLEPAPYRFQRRLYSTPHSPKDSGATNMRILYGLIGLNGAIFAYYQFCRLRLKQTTGNPTQFQAAADSLRSFFVNFTLNLDIIKSGKFWTLLTSTVTHIGTMHLLGNVLSFYFFGRLIAVTPGVAPSVFTSLCFGSAICGGLFSLFHKASKVVARGGGPDTSYSHGFSGVVCGVGSAAAFMYPNTKFLIYGLIPAPLWLLMAGFFVYDGFYLNKENQKVGHAAHLGGTFFGAAFYFLRLRGLKV